MVCGGGGGGNVPLCAKKKKKKGIVSEREFIHPINIYWTLFCVRQGFSGDNSEVPIEFLVLCAEADKKK